MDAGGDGLTFILHEEQKRRPSMMFCREGGVADEARALTARAPSLATAAPPPPSAKHPTSAEECLKNETDAFLFPTE